MPIAKITRRLALAACAFTVAAAAHAAAFPERPITIVVPYAPGGAADAVARLVAARMSTRLGTSDSGCSASAA